MCGIVGAVGNSSELFPIQRAAEALKHRGPDEAGFYIDRNISIGFRRLSIIDISGGQQPIFNEDKTKVIVFNGEIYNFKELREALIARGHLFKTKSDTETILHAYEEWEENCVNSLRGMFAFAIWDRVQRKLFLARDRFGIKPIFYGAHRDMFYFASEIKAILVDETLPREIDELAFTSYFNFSYIPAPLTIFKNIHKLLPGHTLSWKDGHVKVAKYWDLQFTPDRTHGESYFIDGLTRLLAESVKIRLVAEVPLGAFLSGGIDSSTVVALMSLCSSSPVSTFSIGFGGNVGGYLDERKYAEQVAAKYATNHKEYEVHPSPEGLIEKIVRAFDEPFADDSTIPSFFVCKIARENVTVALSGLGGDEVFAGYERYLGIVIRRMFNSFLPERIQGIVRRIVDALPERTDGHYTINHMKRFARSASMEADRAYLGYISVLQPKIKESFFSDMKNMGRQLENCKDIMLGYFNSPNVAEEGNFLDRAIYCDIKTYLPEDILALTDRMSMLHSLEVRVPFLDHKFVEFCARIPAEMKVKWLKKKYLLRKAVGPMLPREVVTHRKQGFVGPMAQWLKTDLKNTVLEKLNEASLAKHGLLNWNTVDRILKEHFSGKEIHDRLIWSILIFQAWYEMYIEKKR